MHEMSIALSVIDIASKEARAGKADKIEAIHLDVGMLAGVMIDSLEFCFDSASKDSMANGAELIINQIPGRGKCLECGTAFEVESFITICPNCGAYRVEIDQGRELRVASITVSD